MHHMKKKLIDITYDLLYKKGYCATNLNEITAKAQITKGSLYYHFDSKHDLVLSSITYYLEYILYEFWVKPLQESQSPKETLTQQITRYQEVFRSGETLKIEHGCPLSNFILDMSDKDEVFFSYLKSVYSRWHEALESALQKAIELNQTQGSFDANDQALFIMSSIEGCIGSAKAYNDIKMLERGFSVLNTYIQDL